jgi:putative DNA primase/helicase
LIPTVGVNLYEGLGVEPRRGNVAPMLAIIDAIIGKRPAIRKWFLQWLAYPLQHPGAKLSSCVYVFSPAQGVGKSAIGEVMCDIYGKHGTSINEGDFFGSWNDWLERSCFALCDELSFEGDKKARSIFKRQITAESVILSGKWRKRRPIRSLCNFYLTGNSPGGLPLEEGENRRVLVIGAQRAIGSAYLTGAFDRWRHKEQGPSHWLYYLLHQVDLGGFHPYMSAPTTEEESLAVQSSGSGLELWLSEALQRAPFTSCDIWTAREVLAVYQLEHPTDGRTGAAAINRALASKPDTQHLRPTWINNVLEVSLWALRRRERWLPARPKAIREEWTRGRPPRKR